MSSSCLPFLPLPRSLIPLAFSICMKIISCSSGLQPPPVALTLLPNPVHSTPEKSLILPLSEPRPQCACGRWPGLALCPSSPLLAFLSHASFRKDSNLFCVARLCPEPEHTEVRESAKDPWPPGVSIRVGRSGSQRSSEST